MKSIILEYDRPEKEWLEALPIGSGRMGAMLFSDPCRDRVDLNEETLLVWFTER